MASDAEVRRELDARIYALELELSGLKQWRNTLSPISHLPPEILCKIFIASVPDIDYKEEKGRTMPHAMALSHVSHGWRAIAINYSEVWGHLHIGVQTKAEVLDFAFGRARHAPIYINLCGFHREGDPSRPSEDTTLALAKIVREGSTRCRALDLYVHEESLRSIFDEQRVAFDSLETLKLDLVGTNDRYGQLTEFLQSSFPQLRRVELGETTPIPSGCNLLQSLHLTYVDIVVIVTTEATMADLYAIFKRSKGLRHFKIRSLSCATPNHVQSQFGRMDSAIPLANLENLVLPLHGMEITQARLESDLLSSLSVLKRCRLKTSYGRSEDPTRLMAALKHMYGDIEPRALHIGKAFVHAWDDSYLDLTNVHQEPWISVSRGIYDHFTYHIWAWGWSFASLRVLILDNLSGALPEEVAPQFWAYLAEAPIEALRIDTHRLDGVPIRQLLKSFRRSALDAPPKTPWASLQRLVSSGLPPTAAYSGEEYTRARQDFTTPPLNPQIEYALDLVDALKAREQTGAGAKPLDLLLFSYPFDHPWKTMFRRPCPAERGRLCGALRALSGRTLTVRRVLLSRLPASSYFMRTF